MNQGRLGLLIIFSLILSLILTGCGAEIARVPIKSVGNYELIFKHDGAPVDLWTDLDLEYLETPNIWYQIMFYRSDELIEEVTCSPFDVEYRLMARNTEVQGVTKESYLAPMICDLDLPAGEIIAKINFFAEGGRVRIFRADLVIKVED